MTMVVIFSALVNEEIEHAYQELLRYQLKFKPWSAFSPKEVSSIDSVITTAGLSFEDSATLSTKRNIHFLIKEIGSKKYNRLT